MSDKNFGYRCVSRTTLVLSRPRKLGRHRKGGFVKEPPDKLRPSVVSLILSQKFLAVNGESCGSHNSTRPWQVSLRAECARDNTSVEAFRKRFV